MFRAYSTHKAHILFTRSLPAQQPGDAASTKAIAKRPVDAASYPRELLASPDPHTWNVHAAATLGEDDVMPAVFCFYPPCSALQKGYSRPRQPASYGATLSATMALGRATFGSAVQTTRFVDSVPFGAVTTGCRRQANALDVRVSGGRRASNASRTTSRMPVRLA
mmetsp:Transcript_30188/g.78244  ORF Transcript_30188/g.78244 Transcript_30188/m.78244 type:complete len:165 (+) Transcript_30188:353-847(+)